MKAIRFERDGDLGSIVLDNPPANWLNELFSDNLADAVHEASESTIRALLIRAEGENFSLGGAAFDWRPDEDKDWVRTFVGKVTPILYGTTDARTSIPQVGAALAAGGPLPDITFIGS